LAAPRTNLEMKTASTLSAWFLSLGQHFSNIFSSYKKKDQTHITSQAP